MELVPEQVGDRGKEQGSFSLVLLYSFLLKAPVRWAMHLTPME